MRASLLLLLSIASAGASAQQLGTLFHSAAEREALDRQRRGEPAAPAALPRADPVITGYVKRSDGRSTVFLDGKPYAARETKAQELLEPRIVDRRDPPPPQRTPGTDRTGQGT